MWGENQHEMKPVKMPELLDAPTVTLTGLFIGLTTLFEMYGLHQACSAFNVVWETSGKLGLLEGNMQLETQNKYTYSYMYKINCVSVHTSSAIKIY